MQSDPCCHVEKSVHRCPLQTAVSLRLRSSSSKSHHTVVQMIQPAWSMGNDKTLCNEPLGTALSLLWESSSFDAVRRLSQPTPSISQGGSHGRQRCTREDRVRLGNCGESSVAIRWRQSSKCAPHLNNSSLLWILSAEAVRKSRNLRKFDTSVHIVNSIFIAFGFSGWKLRSGRLGKCSVFSTYQLLFSCLPPIPSNYEPVFSMKTFAVP